MKLKPLKLEGVRIGRTEEVLVVGPSRRDPDRLTGRTRQNRLVHFSVPSGTGAVRAGSYVTVELTGAACDSLRDGGTHALRIVRECFTLF